jgi:hypothetical protein
MLLENLLLHLTSVNILAVIFDLFIMLTGKDRFLEIIDRLLIIPAKLLGQCITAIDP